MALMRLELEKTEGPEGRGLRIVTEKDAQDFFASAGIEIIRMIG